MPREKFKALTVSEDVYLLAQKIVEKHRYGFTKKRIRSVAHLIEEALIYYIRHELKEDLGKLEKEILEEMKK